MGYYSLLDTYLTRFDLREIQFVVLSFILFKTILIYFLHISYYFLSQWQPPNSSNTIASFRFFLKVLQGVLGLKSIVSDPYFSAVAYAYAVSNKLSSTTDPSSSLIT